MKSTTEAGRAGPQEPVPRSRFVIRPRWLPLTVAAMLVAIIGYLDFATGYEESLLLFYLIPVALVKRNYRAVLAVCLGFLAVMAVMRWQTEYGSRARRCAAR